MTVITRRPPWPSRIGCAVFCTGLSATWVILNTGYYISGQAAAWVFAPLAAMVGVLMAIAWRVATWSFRADAAGLVIHNILTTRRVPLDQVVGFDVGGSRLDKDMVSVRVVTVSGTYRITVFGRRLFIFPGRLCDAADELQAWLDDARAGLVS